MSPRSHPASNRPVLGLAALSCFLAVATTLWAADPPEAREVVVVARDGVSLAGDLYLPSGPGPFPVILGRTPYNKVLGVGFGREGARRGYAVVMQDTRGRFASKGENLPFHSDVTDGADTLLWIGRQDWSNGRVGTWGGSAGAITQFQLMAAGQGGVESQHLVVGAPNLYEVVYTGGVFRKSLIEDWIRASRFQEDAVARWVAHPVHDDYWRERDASRHYGTVQAAAVHIGGYWDIFAQATIDGFNGYQHGGGKGARGRQKLVLGPWTHGVLQEKAGELTFPGGKRPPGNIQDAWQWFDATLRDATNGLLQLPAVTYYVIGDTSDPKAPGNEWRTAESWPPFQVEPVPVYLHGDRTLSTRLAEATHSLGYIHDPAKPVPTLGGVQLTLLAGPMDQQAIESRDDVLVFTGEVLTEPVEVTGRIRARLWISSDAPDTDFMVKLCDVYPDGRSFNLCEGAIRTRFRKGTDREILLESGRMEPVDIDCWATSVVFNRGHRIRVQIASSSSPGYDPNPNTGEPLRKGARMRPARNRVHVGSGQASHVLLPVVKGTLR